MAFMGIIFLIIVLLIIMVLGFMLEFVSRAAAFVFLIIGCVLTGRKNKGAKTFFVLSAICFVPTVISVISRIWSELTQAFQ